MFNVKISVESHTVVTSEALDMCLNNLLGVAARQCGVESTTSVDRKSNAAMG